MAFCKVLLQADGATDGWFNRLLQALPSLRSQIKQFSIKIRLLAFDCASASLGGISEQSLTTVSNLIISLSQNQTRLNQVQAPLLSYLARFNDFAPK
jgi:hypothetical protein